VRAKIVKYKSQGGEKQQDEGEIVECGGNGKDKDDEDTSEKRNRY
jgi:hypothetical protein